MKTRSRLIALVAILVLGALPLFAGTRIVFRWVLTGIPMPAVKKILIVGLTDNYLVRQEFEDKMEELLAKSGVTGIKSHMVFPPKMNSWKANSASASAKVRWMPCSSCVPRKSARNHKKW
jgi:hypothetical protein